MFRSTSSENSHARQQQQVALTGLERAKLERAEQAAMKAPVSAQPAASVAPQPKSPATTEAGLAASTAPSTPRPETRLAAHPAAKPGSEAQLVVGAGVSLKGDVLNCDFVRIEGMVEGNVKARKLTVSAGGTLLGTAEIDAAEIEGRFEGTLAVSGLLVLRGTGRAAGKFAYGDIEIERGGHLSGELLVARQTRAPVAPSKVPSASVESKPTGAKEGNSEATLRDRMWAKAQ